MKGPDEPSEARNCCPPDRRLDRLAWTALTAAMARLMAEQFDAVVFNNVSGDVFTPDQRAAFKAFVENGGGYLGIHAAGDNSHAAWDWYMKAILGTTFTGEVVEATTFGPYAAVVPRVSGTAYIIGRNELLIDPGDPLREGFLLR